jgi:SAM-dependent methyltransferase
LVCCALINVSARFHIKGDIPLTAHSDAARWNDRYRQEGGSWLQRGPSPLLVSYDHLLPQQGLALDAAAGVAANGCYLAARGLRVIALDISEIGLHLGVRRAAARSLPVWGAVCDLETTRLPDEIFAVVVNIRFLARAALQLYRKTLQPGGLLFFEAFLAERRQAVKPYELLPGELRQAFGDYEVLFSTVVASASHPEKKLEQLVARKPGE